MQNYPLYYIELQDLYIDNEIFIMAFEVTLADFINDKDKNDITITNLNENERYISHALTDFYFIKSTSIKNGDDKDIILRKNKKSSIPKELFSHIMKDKEKLNELKRLISERNLPRSMKKRLNTQKKVVKKVIPIKKEKQQPINIWELLN